MNCIIPYVPIAPRIQADHQKAITHCKPLFALIDELEQNSDREYNHSHEIGYLAINAEHLNDLAESHEQTRLNMANIEKYLNKLSYPIFLGCKKIQSALWDTKTTVWLFQLNQIRGENPMYTFDLDDDATLALDKATALIKTLRKTLEVAGNHELTYTNNDLLYSLLTIEDLLDIVVSQVETNQTID